MNETAKELFSMFKAQVSLTREQNKDTSVVKILTRITSSVDKAINAIDTLLKKKGIDVKDLSKKATAKAKTEFESLQEKAKPHTEQAKGMFGRVRSKVNEVAGRLHSTYQSYETSSNAPPVEEQTDTPDERDTFTRHKDNVTGFLGKHLGAIRHVATGEFDAIKKALEEKTSSGTVDDSIVNQFINFLKGERTQKEESDIEDTDGTKRPEVDESEVEAFTDDILNNRPEDEPEPETDKNGKKKGFTAKDAFRAVPRGLLKGAGAGAGLAGGLLAQFPMLRTLKMSIGALYSVTKFINDATYRVIKGTLKGVWKLGKGAVGLAHNVAKKLIPGYALVSKGLGFIKDKAVAGVKAVGQYSKDKITGAGRYVGDKLLAGKDYIGNKLKSAGGAVTGLVERTNEGILKGLTGAKNFAVDKAKNLSQGVMSLFKGKDTDPALALQQEANDLARRQIEVTEEGLNKVSETVEENAATGEDGEVLDSSGKRKRGWWSKLKDRVSGRKEDIEAKKAEAKGRAKKEPSWLTSILKKVGMVTSALAVGWGLIKQYGMEGLKKLGGWLWKGTKWLSGKLWEGLKWTAKKIGKLAWEGVKWLGAKTWEGVKWVGKFIWDKTVGAFKNLGSTVSNGLKNAGKASWEGTKWLAGKFFDGFKWLGKSIWDAIANLGKKVVDIVKAPLKAVSEPAKKVANFVKGKAGSILSGAKNLIGSAGAKVAAKGGIKALARGAALFLGPAGLVLSAGMLLWDAYSVYKWMKEKGSPTTIAGKLSKLRMMSYGFGDEQANDYNKLISLEAMLHQHVVVDSESKMAKIEEIPEDTYEPIKESFRIDSTNEAQFEEWLKGRFIPAYLSFQTAVMAVKGGDEPFDLGTLNELSDEQLSSMANYYSLQDSVWVITDIPSGDGSVSTVTKEDFYAYLRSILGEQAVKNPPKPKPTVAPKESNSVKEVETSTEARPNTKLNEQPLQVEKTEVADTAPKLPKLTPLPEVTEEELKDLNLKVFQLRLIAYGVDREDRNMVRKIFRAEQAILSAMRVDRKEKTVKLDNMDNFVLTSVMSAFNTSMGANGDYRVISWINNRFKPIYENYLTSLYNSGTRLNIIDPDIIKKLDPIELLKALKGFEVSEDFFRMGHYPSTDLHDTPKTTYDDFTYFKKDLMNTAIELTKKIAKIQDYEDNVAIRKRVEEAERKRLAEQNKPLAPEVINKPTEPKVDKATAQAEANIAKLNSKANSTVDAEEAEDPKIYEAKPDTTKAPVPMDPGKVPMADGELYEGDASMEGITLNGKLGKETLTNLDPGVFKLFTGMAKEYKALTGKNLGVNFGWRSMVEQQRLYDEKKGQGVAKPGNSLHEYGLAVDINTVDVKALEQLGLLRKYGFATAIGKETWHLEPIGLSLDPQRAKFDKGWRDSMIASSPGRGGDGFAMVYKGPHFTRDVNYQKKLYETPESGTILIKDGEPVVDNTKQEESGLDMSEIMAKQNTKVDASKAKSSPTSFGSNSKFKLELGEEVSRDANKVDYGDRNESLTSSDQEDLPKKVTTGGATYIDYASSFERSRTSDNVYSSRVTNDNGTVASPTSSVNANTPIVSAKEEPVRPNVATTTTRTTTASTAAPRQTTKPIETVTNTAPVIKTDAIEKSLVKQIEVSTDMLKILELIEDKLDMEKLASLIGTGPAPNLAKTIPPSSVDLSRRSLT